MSSNDIKVSIDSSEVDEKLDQIEKKSSDIYRVSLDTARKGFDTIVILGQLTGSAVDQSYQLMAQSLFIGAETVLTIAQAQTVTGVGAINAALSFLVAAALFDKAIKLQLGQEGQQRELDAVIALANTWRLQGI